MKQFCFADIKPYRMCVIQITGTKGEVAQGNNHQRLATTEPGDLPDILHWDECADRQVKKKWLDKKRVPKVLVEFRRKQIRRERIYGPFQAFRRRWESDIFPGNICWVSAVVCLRMRWDHGSGMGHSKALQLHRCGRERNPGLLWLARSPNAGQYFQRLGDCSSASLQKCLRFPSTSLDSLPFPLHHDRTPPRFKPSLPTPPPRRVALSSP